MKNYWRILKTPLIDEVQNHESPINKVWILETFASTYFHIENKMHQSINKLCWLEKNITRNLNFEEWSKQGKYFKSNPRFTALLGTSH
jgi:hypothetical protein